MENISRPRTEDEVFELPPGFRFHPTDEELITQYLSHKVLDSCFCARAIGEVELNKCEPWDLPLRATMGEKEWYFFCLRDKKYPTGSRTNRATDSGYWKATGRDKKIYKAKALIGMKKTLVFYRGRAPQGDKTSWVMHEYRLEGKLSKNNLPETAKNEWVICRFFEKNYAGKKMHIPELLRLNSIVKDPPSLLPPFTEDGKSETPIVVSSSSSDHSDITPATWNFPTATYQSTHIRHQMENSEHPDHFLVGEDFMKRMLIENHGSSTKQNQKAEFSRERDFDADISSVVYNNLMVHRSIENQEYSSSSAGPVNMGCPWNY